MPTEAYAHGMTALVISRRFLTSLFDSIPDDRLCYQPFPKANHALWIAGHVATTDAFFLSHLAGLERERFETWKDIFFMGSTPKPEPSAYPARAEIVGVLESTRTALLHWFESMNRDQMEAPLPEEMASFAPNYGDLIATIACHESMHAGQITTIRKALGMDSMFA